MPFVRPPHAGGGPHLGIIPRPGGTILPAPRLEPPPPGGGGQGVTQQDLLGQVQAAIDSALPVSPERAAIDAAFALLPASARAAVNAALAKVCTSSTPAPPAATGMSTAGVVGIAAAAAAVGLAGGYALKRGKR